MAAPAEVWAVLAFLFGAIIGSFLNVVIWRLPRRESLSHPSSHCPHCNRNLAAFENVPLFSYLALRGQCRTCKARISPRYFWVELLTAVLFLVITLHFGPTLQSVVYCLFVAALIPAFFIDAALFIIPDEINTFILLLGFAWDGWGIARGDPQHALVWGWLPRSLLGAVICAGVFVGIQILGYALFRKGAMGDGDVKLARAIGAVMPLKLALVSFMLAVGVGVLFSAFKLTADAMRAKGKAVPSTAGTEGGGAELPADEEDAEETTMKEVLLYGVIYLFFVDLIVQFLAFVGVPAAKKLAGEVSEEDVEAEDDFVAGPTHIPFGPHMVVGALLALFVGERIVDWYLKWAHLA